MDFFDRLLIVVLVLLFISVGSLMYLDKRNRMMNTHRITVKLDHAKRLLDDARNVSRDLQIKSSLENLEGNGDVFIEGDESSKEILLEALDLKDKVVQECLYEAQQCIKDIINELN